MALVLMAVPASAGDHITDPIDDFDCDDQRDAVDPDRYATVNGHTNAGAITIQVSGDGGIMTLTQASPGIAGGPEEDDLFSSIYTSFDDNGDGCDDLVIAAPFEDLVAGNGSEATDAGMIWIVPGSPDGLRPEESRAVNLHTPGIPGAVGKFHRFGLSLAGGNTITHEPYLLIGAPGYTVGKTGYAAGAVYYARGDETYQLTQDSSGVPGVAEPRDYFGEYIVATNRYIAVSAPGEAIGDRSSSGMVHVFIHTITDAHLRSLSSFHQNTDGIYGVAESGDRFGGSLSIINYQHTLDAPIGAAISVGTPGEQVGAGGRTYNGMAHLIRHDNTGEPVQQSYVHQDLPGVDGIVEVHDRFGFNTVVSATTSSDIGTPSTTAWTVASWELPDEDGGDGYNDPQVQVFPATGDPGDNDHTIAHDDYGLPLLTVQDIESLQASYTYLYIGVPGLPGQPSEVYGIPWQNVLGGQNAPVIKIRVQP